MGNPSPDAKRGTPIRSFVRRDSRMTPAQKAALEALWPRYVLPLLNTRDDLDAAFGRPAPTTLEIGSGDGACTLALAGCEADQNYIAVDVYRPGLGRLLHRAASESLSNIRVSDEDICDLLGPITEPVFDRVLVFFPDPWPKKRHNKRRLLQQDFFNLLLPRVQRHGRVFIATDNAEYAESVVATIEQLPCWINLAGPGAWAPRAAFRPITKFEAKAGAAGSRVFDIVLARA